MSNQKRTVVGTDIEAVKRQNAESGLSFNDIKELAANHGWYIKW